MSGPVVKALLLDLDRTLVDVQTFTDYSAALDEVGRLLGEMPKTDVPDTSWDSPTRACMQILVALTGDAGWERVSSVIEGYELEALSRAQPMPGLGELVASLSPDLPTAVVTLLGPNATDRVLEQHQIPIATRVPRRPDLTPKPAPDQLLEASRLLDVRPSETVMVGDSTWDLRAAQSAGAGFIGITNHRPSEFPGSTPLVADLAELTDEYLDRERTHPSDDGRST